jgi:hypothetical protein
MTASTVPTASARSDPEEKTKNIEIQEAKETKTHKVYTATIDGDRYVYRVNKSEGSVKFEYVGPQSNVSVQEVDKNPSAAEKSISVTEAATAVPDFITRVETYTRVVGSCSLDSCEHKMMGTSVEFAWWLADVAQGVIVTGIMVAMASTGAGTLAAFVGNAYVQSVVGTVATQLAGNSLTIGMVERDLDYLLGKQKITYGGYGLGPWKPGPNGLIGHPAPDTYHLLSCD